MTFQTTSWASFWNVVTQMRVEYAGKYLYDAESFPRSPSERPTRQLEHFRDAWHVIRVPIFCCLYGMPPTLDHIYHTISSQFRWWDILKGIDGIVIFTHPKKLRTLRTPARPRPKITPLTSPPPYSRFRALYDMNVTSMTLYAGQLPPQYTTVGASLLSVLRVGVTLAVHHHDPMLLRLSAAAAALPTSSRDLLRTITLVGPITDEELAAIILPHAHRVHTIKITDASALTATSLDVLAHGQRVVDLTIHGLRDYITDDHLCILSRLSGLEGLSLRGAAGVKGTFLDTLARSCPALARLQLLDCATFDQASLDTLRLFPNLHRLDIAYAMTEMLNVQSLNDAVVVGGWGATNPTNPNPTPSPPGAGPHDGNVGHDGEDIDDDMSMDFFPQEEAHSPLEIDDRALLSVRHCRALQSLYLSDCLVSDTGVRELVTLSHLQSVVFEGCDFVTGSGLTFLGQLSQLTTLRLLDCGDVSDAALVRFQSTPGAARLEELSLSPCAGLTNVGLKAIGQLPGLTRVSLMFADQLEDEGVLALTQHGRLEQVVLMHVHGPGLTGEGVGQALGRCPRLKVVRVGFFQDLRAEHVAHLPSACPWLESLDLTLTHAPSHEMLHTFTASLPQIRTLRVALSRPVVRLNQHQNPQSGNGSTTANHHQQQPHHPDHGELDVVSTHPITPTPVSTPIEMETSEYLGGANPEDKMGDGSTVFSSQLLFGSHILGSSPAQLVPAPPPRLNEPTTTTSAGTTATVSSLLTPQPTPRMVQHLTFPEGTRLSDAMLVSLAVTCPDLRTLDASRCVGFTDRGVKAVLMGCRQLEVLKLRGCASLTGRFLKSVPRSSQLIGVHLGMCPLRPHHVVHLARCRRLKFVEVSWAVDSSDGAELEEAIRVVRAGCPRLVQIRASVAATTT